MSTLPVTSWPSYLLQRVPENLRSSLVEDAAEDDTSVSDVIRKILCARYQLDCPQVSYEYSGRGIRATILIRLQPELSKRLLHEAELERTSIRQVILSTLEHHYNGKES